MTPAAYWMVGLIAILQLKHFVFDFPLQSGYMAGNKGHYGHRAGFLHAGLHGLGSIPAALFAGTALVPAVLIIAGEIIVHYHIDWLKSSYGHNKGLTPSEHSFWIAFGVDQGLHHVTYLVMAVLFVAYS